MGEGTEDNESLERGKAPREQDLDTAIGLWHVDEAPNHLKY